MSYASFNSFDNYSPIELLQEEIPQSPSPPPPPPKQAATHPKQMPPTPHDEPVYDFNKEFEKMQAVKAQYMLQPQAQVVAVPAPAPSPADSQGYFDKLFSRKKDFLKLLQWVLIVLLAIAIHGFIKYYLYQYLSNGDFSFEREMVIRALYPLGILFILWNLRVFAGKS